MKTDRIKVNYIGGTEFLEEAKAAEVADIVISNYWKLDIDMPEKMQVDINFVSEEDITRMNNEYLDKNNPTDVISFALLENGIIPGESLPLLGQIVISEAAVREQAGIYGNSETEETLLLLIHGLLHLIGWSEGKEIKLCQERIKKKINQQI